MIGFRDPKTLSQRHLDVLGVPRAPGPGGVDKEDGGVRRRDAGGNKDSVEPCDLPLSLVRFWCLNYVASTLCFSNTWAWVWSFRSKAQQ